MPDKMKHKSLRDLEALENRGKSTNIIKCPAVCAEPLPGSKLCHWASPHSLLLLNTAQGFHVYESCRPFSIKSIHNASQGSMMICFLFDYQCSLHLITSLENSTVVRLYLIPKWREPIQDSLFPFASVWEAHKLAPCFLGRALTGEHHPGHMYMAGTCRVGVQEVRGSVQLHKQLLKKFCWGKSLLGLQWELLAEAQGPKFRSLEQYPYWWWWWWWCGGAETEPGSQPGQISDL